MQTCNRLLHEQTHLFYKMWGREERVQNVEGGVACWDFQRGCRGGSCKFWERGLPATTFWDETSDGTHCGDNWYEGSGQSSGRFQRPAPALLGFDDSIHWACNNNCDWANYNILQLVRRPELELLGL